jgi:molecular chaperone GrpE
MSNRMVYQALNDLAQRIDALRDGYKPAGGLDELEKQIKRLAKEVYKTNTLTETQAGQTAQAVEQTGQTLAALADERERIAQQARLEVIKALMPVLDSVESGIASGVKQLQAILPQAPNTAHILATWLDGQRLLHARLLKMLEAEGVRPIPSVGQMFDPYKHVAVKAVADSSQPEGVILSEQRRGYMHRDTVLRFADVVVNRHPSEDTEK